MHVICYNRPVEGASSNDYKTRVRPELCESLAAVEVVSCIRITSEQFKSIRPILFQNLRCFAVKIAISLTCKMNMKWNNNHFCWT